MSESEPHLNSFRATKVTISEREDGSKAGVLTADGTGAHNAIDSVRLIGQAVRIELQGSAVVGQLRSTSVKVDSQGIELVSVKIAGADNLAEAVGHFAEIVLLQPPLPGIAGVRK